MVFPLICKILKLWKLFLVVVGIFVFFYLIIYPPKVFKLDNIVQEQHPSTVQDIKVKIHNDNGSVYQSNLTMGYLVYGENCQIKDLDPFNREIMMHFNRVTYAPCELVSPVSRVHYDEKTQHYELTIDGDAFESYPIEDTISCCYMNVLNYTECEKIISRSKIEKTLDGIIVKCFTATQQIYINGHAMVPERREVRQRLTQWASRDAGRRVPSVLMIGIDSVSRLNLIRAMAKTAQYLYDNDWFELAGYNMIADNRIPNLMAAMTGNNRITTLKEGNSYETDALKRNKFIWNLYQEHGYVTAYGEDAMENKTFNNEKDLNQSPTDYFLGPYLSAAKRLLDSTDDCMGYKKKSEHVYDYALEFARRYRNDSFFGFFWINSHSHSDLSQTSSMDDYLKDYLQRLVAQGTMENSIVVFFSDHGLSLGPTRTTWTGHYEVRLPFLFIWLPQFVREAHPEFVEALRENRNRLTTPFDLHLTLKHILAFSGRASSMESLGGAQDCPKCQSLLEPVPLSRSCMDVGIEDHWCTCWSYDRVDRNSKTVQHIANRVVEYMNRFIANYSEFCETLKLQYVLGAYRSNINKGNSKNLEVYLIHFTTKHNKAVFEATATYNIIQPAAINVKVSKAVSRLDSHDKESSCVMDVNISKYCWCRSQTQSH